MNIDNYCFKNRPIGILSCRPVFPLRLVGFMLLLSISTGRPAGRLSTYRHGRNMSSPKHSQTRPFSSNPLWAPPTTCCLQGLPFAEAWTGLRPDANYDATTYLSLTHTHMQMHIGARPLGPANKSAMPPSPLPKEGRKGREHTCRSALSAGLPMLRRHPWRCNWNTNGCAHWKNGRAACA